MCFLRGGDERDELLDVRSNTTSLEQWRVLSSEPNQNKQAARRGRDRARGICSPLQARQARRTTETAICTGPPKYCSRSCRPSGCIPFDRHRPHIWKQTMSLPPTLSCTCFSANISIGRNNTHREIHRYSPRTTVLAVYNCRQADLPRILPFLSLGETKCVSDTRTPVISARNCRPEKQNKKHIH